MLQGGLVDLLNLFAEDVRVDESLKPVLWNWGFGAVEIFTGEFFSSKDVVDSLEVLIGEIVCARDDLVDNFGVRGHGGDVFLGDLFDLFLKFVVELSFLLQVGVDGDGHDFVLEVGDLLDFVDDLFFNVHFIIFPIEILVAAVVTDVLLLVLGSH